MTGVRVVVVGAGLAGASTAVRLRQLGFDGSVALVGDEVHLPYERPGLSKTYLTGRVSQSELLVQPASAYEELDIELRRGTTVTALDTERRLIRTWDSDELPYDALVIATGARNIVPPLPGMDLRGVHQLRTIEDADWLCEHAATATTAVIVGMGFVGCEVAATLRGLGLAVTMVDRAEGPLLAQLGPQISDIVSSWHRDHGVEIVGGVGVESIVGDRGVDGVVLSDGRRLPADLVVVGVGARPNTAWLQDTPVHLVGRAVGVDGSGRTSIEGVWAAGDVTAFCDPVTGDHRRVEHYRSAIDEADRVAHTIVGLQPPAAAPSWFWSDQYEHTLHYAGERREDDQVHARTGGPAVFWLRDGTLAAVATVDAGRDFRRSLRLLGQPVDASMLTTEVSPEMVAG